MTRPVFSIIMAAYNAEPFLAEAAASVRAQTRPDWELVIVDDGSTDATPLIAEALAQADARIRVRRVDRLGSPARARNAGIEWAQGEFITFLDADDRFPPTTLADYADALAGDPSLIAVYGFVGCLDQNGAPAPGPGFQLRLDDQGQPTLPKGYAHTWRRVALGQIESSIALMARADALRAMGGFNESLEAAEDLALRYQLFLRHFHAIRPIARVAYLYRLNPTSLTRSKPNADRLLRNHLGALDALITSPQAPSELLALTSQAYAKRYRYAASVILSQGRPGLARQTAARVFGDRRVKTRDALTAFLPLAVRSCLPGAFERTLKTWAVRLRDGALTSRQRIASDPPGGDETLAPGDAAADDIARHAVTHGRS